MAVRIVKLPDVGEGVAEAEIAEWHVKAGDRVAEDQVLAAVMTDKATVEIPAPVAGTIVGLGGEVGEMLAVGAALVRIDVAEPDEAPAAAEDNAPVPAEAPARPLPVVLPSPAARPLPPAAVVGPGGPPRPPGEKPVAAPSVRNRAREAGVDLRQVRGTGPAGRIGHDDLDLFLRGVGQPAAIATGRPPDTRIEEMKLTGLRRRIAQRMAEATRRVAHFSYVEEIDVTALEDLRTALNAEGGHARLTLLPLLIRAIVKAVADFPQMNAHYDDEADIVRRFGGVHVGIATQTPQGLMVPVVRHAEARDIRESGAEVKRLADAARAGLATREELSGSTITITSLGAIGGIVSTPVVNRPEVAIVGVNRQMVRAVWLNGQFVPRTMMNLSSSFDHRIVDGHDAALFIQRIKGLLEKPATLFI